MESIDKQCTELKHRYDECFNTWFSEKFLNGNHHDTCQPLFLVYQQCVKEAIKRRKIDISEVEKRVLGTEMEPGFESKCDDKNRAKN
ncbi:TP53-regulated inhibitor of apoptosis 1-like protein [Dinothrombium tinctorium]|uniref:TP53-regulated inhibitor of apoptosis 1-like protein n=1 Tax=Dinothrombium tinctorium TaxID=1965070 RepID=A0A443R016_9ACAR|nr:TP53-regulated inhibitor of apoptosis 1-like protein [Dinothrombium tinctorium]